MCVCIFLERSDGYLGFGGICELQAVGLLGKKQKGS